MGTPLEFDTFMSAVIDGKSFNRIKGYIDHAKSGPNTSIVAGGTYDDSVGYFVQPTVVQGSVQQSRLISQFEFRCCNLPQQFQLDFDFNLEFRGVQNGFQMGNDSPPDLSTNFLFAN